MHAKKHLELYMNRIKLYSTKIFLIIFFSNTTYGDDNVKRINLLVGESKKFTLSSPDEISLSKKGIILCTHLNGNKWRITALRTGFVIMSWYLNNSTKQIMVSVNKYKDKYELIKAPKMLCAHKGIVCDPKKLKIFGTINSTYLLKQAVKICNKSTKFYCDLEISTSVIKDIKTKLTYLLGHNYELHALKNGMIHIMIPCGASEKDNISRRKIIELFAETILPKSNYIISCKHLLNPKYFQLKAKVILTSIGIANKLGLNTTAKNILTAGREPLLNLRSKFQSLEQKNKVKILGQPIVTAQEGLKSYAHSGGEILYLENSEQENMNNSSKWKSYGIEFTTTAFSKSKSNVVVHYVLDFKIPVHNGTNRFHSNNIKGSVDLVLKEPAIVAGIEYLSQSTSKSSIPIIDKLPIVSILSKLFTKSHKKQMLYLWLEAWKIEKKNTSQQLPLKELSNQYYLKHSSS